ncbi:MAG: CopG family transcriptional regulator [Actinomycetota bacterium]
MKRETPDAQVTLKIPRPLYEQLKQVIEGSGFHSVTEFAVYVLRDLVSHHDRIPSPAQESDVEALSPAEIEAIRKRLESLGYL